MYGHAVIDTQRLLKSGHETSALHVNTTQEWLFTRTLSSAVTISVSRIVHRRQPSHLLASTLLPRDAYTSILSTEISFLQMILLEPR